MLQSTGWSRGDAGVGLYDRETVVNSQQEQEIFLIPKRPDRLLAHQVSYSLGMICDGY